MVEFPPNFDDGELWFPSNIFLEEVPSKFGTHHLPSPPCLIFTLIFVFSGTKQKKKKNLEVSYHIWRASTKEANKDLR